MMNVTANDLNQFVNGKYECIESSKLITAMNRIKDILYKSDSKNKELDDLYNEYVLFLKDKPVSVVKDNSECKQEEHNSNNLRKEIDEILKKKPAKRGKKRS